MLKMMDIFIPFVLLCSGIVVVLLYKFSIMETIAPNFSKESMNKHHIEQSERYVKTGKVLTKENLLGADYESVLNWKTILLVLVISAVINFFK